MDARVVALTEALAKMVRILKANGESHWSTVIEDDLNLMRKGGTSGAERFLAHFGGMGSLNDVWLCKENGNVVEKSRETRANREFDEAKGRAWNLARAIVEQAV